MPTARSGLDSLQTSQTSHAFSVRMCACGHLDTHTTTVILWLSARDPTQALSGFLPINVAITSLKQRVLTLKRPSMCRICSCALGAGSIRSLGSHAPALLSSQSMYFCNRYGVVRVYIRTAIVQKYLHVFIRSVSRVKAASLRTSLQSILSTASNSAGVIQHAMRLPHDNTVDLTLAITLIKALGDGTSPSRISHKEGNRVRVAITRVTQTLCDTESHRDAEQ